jgi:hypothetical protein
MPKGAYTSELSPVAYYGQPVLLDSGSEQQAYRVTQVIPQVGITTDTVTINGQDEEVNVKATELETWDGWLAQWRPTNWTQDIPDDINITVDQGANNKSVYQTRNSQGVLEADTPSELLDEGPAAEITNHANLLEFYVFEDEPPRITYENPTAGQETVSIEFTGFAFNVERISGAPDEQPVYVPVEGISGQ